MFPLTQTAPCSLREVPATRAWEVSHRLLSPGSFLWEPGSRLIWAGEPLRGTATGPFNAEPAQRPGRSTAVSEGARPAPRTHCLTRKTLSTLRAGEPGPLPLLPHSLPGSVTCVSTCLCGPLHRPHHVPPFPCTAPRARNVPSFLMEHRWPPGSVVHSNSLSKMQHSGRS